MKWVIITGIFCVTLLELAWMYLGHNGASLMLCIGIIAAAIGITIPTPKALQTNFKW